MLWRKKCSKYGPHKLWSMNLNRIRGAFTLIGCMGHYKSNDPIDMASKGGSVKERALKVLRPVFEEAVWWLMSKRMI